MDVMVIEKDDLEVAKEYYNVYIELRTALREGKIETSDVEDYLAYREHLLTKRAKQLAQEMIDNYVK